MKQVAEVEQEKVELSPDAAEEFVTKIVEKVAAKSFAKLLGANPAFGNAFMDGVFAKAADDVQAGRKPSKAARRLIKAMTRKMKRAGVQMTETGKRPEAIHTVADDEGKTGERSLEKVATGGRMEEVVARPLGF